MIQTQRVGMHLPQREPIEPRDLSSREISWLREIVESNPQWADSDLNAARVVARCACGKCRTVFLECPSPQNPLLAGTKGWVGRVEIMTTDDFLITVTVDQRDGSLSGLYVDIDALDLRELGDRAFPDEWRERTTQSHQCNPASSQSQFPKILFLGTWQSQPGSGYILQVDHEHSCPRGKRQKAFP
jgi:hypothetical protein